MPSKTYTYQINIVNDSRVAVRRIKQDGKSDGSPSGTFRYQDGYRSRILELAQKARERTITSDEVEALGTALFQTLFDDSLRVNLLSKYNELRQDREMIFRVELGVDEALLPEIAALPWEFMYAPTSNIAGNFWLATDPTMVFSRRRDLWEAAHSIQLGPQEKLRIALIVSTPSDLRTVKYEQIHQALQQLQTEQSDLIELLPLVNPATAEAIDELLEVHQPHIFHFIGHGRFKNDDGREIGELALMHESGMALWVDAPDFSTLFARHTPGVVFLQACEGAALSASEAFTGIASHIVQQYIPVVLAMQYEISNHVARKFALEFYKRLAQAAPVDTAAQEGRNRIAEFNKNRHFATPVLFMRAEDGHLFAKAEMVEDLDEDNDNDADNETIIPADDRRQFRQKVNTYFSFEELRTICFDMNINEEEFPLHSGKTAFIKALVGYLERNGRLDEFLSLIRTERRNVQWP